MGLEARVGRFVVDNFYELELLNELARQHKTKAKILLRVSPGIDAHTHHYIKTGMIDSKFGLAIANGQALMGVEKALSMKNLELKGIHCHIGSQIFDINSFQEAANVMMTFAKDLKTRTGFVTEELNLGGGLGIYYSEGDAPQSVARLASIIANAVKEAAAEFGLPLPKIIVEPGRSIVGEAGITLYTVGSVKEIPGVRKYVAVDGGMTDNPRPALYQAKYEAALANKMNNPAEETVSIAGKCCESGDMLIWDTRTAQGCSRRYPGGFLHRGLQLFHGQQLQPHSATGGGVRRQCSADLVVRRETYGDLTPQ